MNDMIMSILKVILMRKSTNNLKLQLWKLETGLKCVFVNIHKKSEIWLD